MASEYYLTRVVRSFIAVKAASSYGLGVLRKEWLKGHGHNPVMRIKFVAQRQSLPLSAILDLRSFVGIWNKLPLVGLFDKV